MTRDELKELASEIVSHVDSALSELRSLQDEAEATLGDDDCDAWDHLTDLESALDNARESAFTLTSDVWGDEDEADEG